MTANERFFEALLDMHLDRLDAREREELLEACRGDAALAAANARLGEILQPLDHWGMTPPVPRLAERVLSYVEDSTIEASVPSDAEFPAPVRRRWPFVSLREPLAVAACIALLLGVFFPGVSALRHNSRTAICADNLRSIHHGTTLYQAAFGGALPYAGRVPGASWLPSETGDRRLASNSRHVFLLVKLGYGPQSCDFVCPGGAGEAMHPDQVAQCADFGRACNINYAAMNLSGPSPNLRPQPTLAYIGDANPLFVNARFDPSIDPDRANSPAHGGKGQMILTLDGAARWLTSPVLGAKKDNVWLAGDIRRYTGVESPVSADDAQLVPGYPATDRSYSRSHLVD